MHFSKLEFQEAFQSNALLFFVVPALAVCTVIKVIFVPDVLMPESRFYKVSTVILLIALLCFDILRNIFGF